MEKKKKKKFQLRAERTPQSVEFCRKLPLPHPPWQRQFVTEFHASAIPERTLRVGIFFLLFLCVKSISASLECSSGELCVLDQLLMPSFLVIMSVSIWCIVVKSLVVAK